MSIQGRHLNPLPEIDPGLFFFEGMAYSIPLVSKTTLKPVSCPS
jgi:hypothetical protein